MGKRPRQSKVVVAVSGGPDSVFLLHRALEECERIVVGHVNHRARGAESDEDERFVRRIAAEHEAPVRVLRVRDPAAGRPGFEEGARRTRYRFLKDLKKREGADAILVGHTADDQVETILMRVVRGTGISGLKGIPRTTGDGVVRPLLDTWRGEILSSLKDRGIPHRRDRSNADTRFERNWIRHVLIPVLVERYGESVKARIRALGERFREIDEFLESAAARWIGRHVRRGAGRGEVRFNRVAFAGLPSLLRMRILLDLAVERTGIAPSGRLLEGMDRLVVSGGPSASLSVGGRATMSRRYGEVSLAKCDRAVPPSGPGTAGGAIRRSLPAAAGIRGPGAYPLRDGAALVVGERVNPGAARLRSRAKGERIAYFDAEGLEWPIRVRPLRAGDRIRPFGMNGGKKIKEILIDRKIPRAERWGRPAVCDARGRILWIPGVVRSAWAAVPAGARAVLRFEMRPEGREIP